MILPGMPYLLAGAFAIGAFSAYKVMDWRADAAQTEALTVSLDMLDKVHKEARAEERAHDARLAKIGAQLNKEKRNGKAETDRLRKLVAAGKLRLREPDSQANGSGDRGGTDTVAACPGGSDGTKNRELSTATVEFLLALTGEADTVAIQLAACQAVIRSDRER